MLLICEFTSKELLQVELDLLVCIVISAEHTANVTGRIVYSAKLPVYQIETTIRCCQEVWFIYIIVTQCVLHTVLVHVLLDVLAKLCNFVYYICKFHEQVALCGTCKLHKSECLADEIVMLDLRVLGHLDLMNRSQILHCLVELIRILLKIALHDIFHEM